jgi:hypothetical protein
VSFFGYYSVFYFLFSLSGGLVFPGGYADLAWGCLWEYYMLFSSPGDLLLSSWYELASGGAGALLVSLFTVK